MIERGALDKTDFRDVLFCINHDIRKIPLARSRNNNENSTMNLSVDDKACGKSNSDVERNAERRRSIAGGRVYKRDLHVACAQMGDLDSKC